MNQSEMRRKMNPQTVLEMKFQGATQQTASRQGRYPFINKDKLHDDRSFMTPIRKMEPASLAKETKSTKSQLVATITSESITPENESKRNPKIDKNVLAVRKFVTVLEPVLDIARRRARDEEIIKKKLNNNKPFHHAIVLFQIIQQDYPEKIFRSIQCLTDLVENSKFSNSNQKIYSRESITQYFTQVLCKCSTKTYFKLMTGLLKCRIFAIAEQLPSSFPMINGRVEIVSLVLKTILEFQEYLPPQDYSYNSNLWHINPKFISIVLNIPEKQYKIIKKLFIENYSRLAYISNEFRIHDLVMAYYILSLKNKYLKMNFGQMQKYPLQPTRAEFKARKLKVTERKKNEMIEEGSITLSQLYANRRQAQKSKRQLSSQEMIDTCEIFEEIEQSNIEHVTAKHPKIQMLANKYQTRARFIVDKCRRFINRKRDFIVRYGNSLSEMKDELITRQLIRDPYYSYEEVFSHIYHRNSLYVEQSYFEGNVHRLLQNETHYQQLRYLEKVFKVAFQRKEKTNVFFVDRCSLIEDRESSAIVIVSLTGALHCEKSLDGQNFLKEVKGFLKTQQSSVVLLFDDEFPFSARLEETKEAFLISKIHSLCCFLPRASLVPNPCMAIANSLKQMFTEQYSLEETISTMLKEFDRARVMDVAQKEWEKAQRLAYPDNPQRNQQLETNRDERADQSIEEGSDLQDNQDEEEGGEEDEEEDENQHEDKNEDRNEEVNFPRQSNPKSQPLILENLLGHSVSDLQRALARLLQLNKSSSKNP